MQSLLLYLDYICIYYFVMLNIIMLNIIFVLYLSYICILIFVLCKNTSKINLAKENVFLWSFGRCWCTFAKYLCIWFCVMFVGLAQTGENQLNLRKWWRGGGSVCYLFYMVSTIVFSKKFSEKWKFQILRKKKFLKKSFFCKCTVITIVCFVWVLMRIYVRACA